MLFIKSYAVEFESCTVDTSDLGVRVSTCQQIVIRNSTVRLVDTAVKTATFWLDGPNLRIEASRFWGNGSVGIAKAGLSLESGEIANNTFQGVKLQFGDLTRGLIYSATHGEPEKCGVVGAEAGCDPRAQCVDLDEGGVKCTCATPLKFQTGALPDGSQCEAIYDISKICKGARVLLNGQEIDKGDTAVAQIGTSGFFSVDARSNVTLRYRYVPLESVQERELAKDLKIEWTGMFQVDMYVESTSDSCRLLHNLEVRCAGGFIARGGKCAPGMHHIKPIDR